MTKAEFKEQTRAALRQILSANIAGFDPIASFHRINEEKKTWIFIFAIDGYEKTLRLDFELDMPTQELVTEAEQVTLNWILDYQRGYAT